MHFKITDIDNERYYQMPKSLFSYQAYIGLSLQAKVIYCILKDRMSLSRKNRWIDSNGDIYLMFQQQEIADILHVNKSTVCRDMKSLVAYGLIEISDQGRGRCHRIYINKIRVPESTDEISNAEEQLGEAALRAEEEERQYQALLHPELAGNAICNPRVASGQPSVAQDNLRVARMQQQVAATQLRVAQEQPQVAPMQYQVAQEQPRVAPTQPNDTNLENLTKETEYNVPETTKYEEDEEDMRARVQSATELNDVMQYCAENLHPQTQTLAPIEKDMLRVWCQQYSPEWVKAAIHDAVLYGHPTLQYSSKILEGWKQFGFRVHPDKVTYLRLKKAGIGTCSSRKNPTAQQMVNNVKAMCETMGVEL